MTEQEHRRAAFHNKAEIGNKRNNACLAIENQLLKQVLKKDLTIHDAITLSWADGCNYGKEHAEELKVFDKIEQAKETAENFKELTPFQEALIQFGLEFSKYYNEYGNVQDLTKNWTDDLLKLAGGHKAFIEKATNWLWDNIRDYADSIGEYPLMGMLEDFTKAMSE